MSRDELIPAYREAQRKLTEAIVAEHQAREHRNHLQEQMVAALRAEAADQVGRVLRGQWKIVRIGSHWMCGSIAYPVCVKRTAKGWGKREHHLMGWSFNFELRCWESGTVSEDGFKPHAEHQVIVAEAANA